MKIIFSVVIFLCAVTAQAATWTEIADSDLLQVLYDWSPNPRPGMGGINGVLAWSGGAMDTKRNRFILRGGGHGNYGGNELYAFDMDSLTWSRLTDPTPYDDLDVHCSRKSNFLIDGQPRSIHTYDGDAYIPHIDSICNTYGTSGYPQCAAGTELICYSFTTGKYTSSQAVVGLEGKAGAVHQITGDWWLQGTNNTESGRLGHYNAKTGTWETGAYDSQMATTYDKIAAIDPDNGYFILIKATGDLYAFPFSAFAPGTSKVSDYPQTTTGTGPDLARVGNSGGLQYDERLKKIVAWDGGKEIYLLDTKTWVWKKIVPEGDTPNTFYKSGTFGRFSYSPKSDVYFLYNNVSENVFILDLKGSRNSGTLLQSFVLTSGITGRVPFTVGLAFKKGDTKKPTLNIADYQVTVKKVWNDGSVKHAVVSGSVNMMAGFTKTINVFSGGSQPKGVSLTEADIIAAAPTASVQLGSIGTVSLSTLLGSPVRIWVSGPEMVEAHYQSMVGAEASLAVKFHVKLYKGGKIQIRTIVENGMLNAISTDKIYTPTVIIGGKTVFNNGSSDINHNKQTRWDASGWIGTVDPDITIAQDTAYLMASGLVPNYWKTGPSEKALNALTQVYSPLENGQWTPRMGNAGFQSQIGLLPRWDATYINSDGDSRAYRSVIANARALNSYPIIWNDKATIEPIVISSFGTWTYSGAGSGGATGIATTGGLVWDVAHHGSGGYLAYLITGDYYYMETMLHQALTCYLVTSSRRGTGTGRLLLPVQVRGIAWSNRTVGQAVAISPTSSITLDLAALLSTGIDYWLAKTQTPGINGLGYFYAYSANAPNFIWGPGKEAAWQQHFWMQTLGYVSDLEPLTDMTNWNIVRDYLYQGVVGILGGGGAGNYCFTKGGVSTPTISAVNNMLDPKLWCSDWGCVYKLSFGVKNPDICSNVLLDHPEWAAIGYWGNLLPAIAYAAEDGATGAADSWDRITNASNWARIENSGFEDTPNWGIHPRSIGISRPFK